MLVGPQDRTHESLPRLHPGARYGISAGLGVDYLSAPDLANLVNATAGASERVSDFKAMAEFFGAVTIPLSDEWLLKLDYGYLLGSYSMPSAYGLTDYALQVHMPTALLQYVLADEGIYNVVAGAGAGLHVGRLTTTYYSLEQSYTAVGPALMASLEGNTAFGEHLFAHFGLLLRLEMLGSLTDSGGQAPWGSAYGTSTSLSMAGVGVRLGMTYYF